MAAIVGRRHALLIGSLLLAGGGIWLILALSGGPDGQEQTSPKKDQKDELAQQDKLPAELKKTLVKQRGGQRLTQAWSSGKVSFTHDPLTFAIARDYDQQLAIEIENRSGDTQQVVAEVGPLDDGLLGDFTAAGSAIEMPARSKVVLALHLFAQDARRPLYRSHVAVRDAKTAEVLAAAPLTIQVPLPAFNIRVESGPPDPATLARVLTISNDGGPLTDFAVAAGDGLHGKVVFQPSVDHAYLANGQSLRVSVQPVLSTSFQKVAGEVLLRGAGQEQKASLSFDLPAGKRMFVAHAFSTTSDAAAGHYCTNNPNTNTPIGGPTADDEPCPETTADCFGLPAGNRRTSKAGVPRKYDANWKNPTTVTWEYALANYKKENIRTHYGNDYSSREFGKDKKGKPTSEVKKLDFKACVDGKVTAVVGGTWNTVEVTTANGTRVQYLHASKVNVKVGDKVTSNTVIGVTGDQGSPGVVHLHVQAFSKDGKKIDPDCAISGRPDKELPTLPPKDAKDKKKPAGAPPPPPPPQKKKTPKTGGAAGHGASGAAPGAGGGQGRAPARPNATANAPRGGWMRPAYGVFRGAVHSDNLPEAMSAFVDEPGGRLLLLQTWHSHRNTERGMRRIWFAAWDRQTGHAVVPPMPISGEELVQWPALVALPGQRALVVWETSRDVEASEPPALAYVISAPGYESWSAPEIVPGTNWDDFQGNYDPVPVVDAKGNIAIYWQHGDGPGARIMMSRAAADKLPLTFVPSMTIRGLPAGAGRPVPRLDKDGTLHLVFQASVAGDGEGASAVYYASSRDGGETIAAVIRLSPPKIDAGEADLLVLGKKMHVAFRAGPSFESRIEFTSSEDGTKWTPPVAITPAGLFAEYPLWFADRETIGLEYYGERRGPITLKKPRCCNSITDGDSSLKRFESRLGAEGAWSEPTRLPTQFPAVQSLWLQVSFQLRTPRYLYQPHDLAIHFNEVPILEQHDVVPEGTYLVPVDPALLRVDEHGLPKNVIGLRTRHMNPGQYQTAADFRLVARHSFLERLVVAGDQKEADALLAAETERVNHGRPDVGLFVPWLPPEIPAAPKTGDLVKVTVLLGNVGEACAKKIRVGVYDLPPDGHDQPSGKRLGDELAIAELAPLVLQEEVVQFPFTGKERYYLVVQSEGKDFDPKNNVQVVSFAALKPPSLRPLPWKPTQELTLDLADDPLPPFLCRILDAATDKEAARIEWGNLKGKLPTGKYRLALTRFEGGQEVVFPDLIQHEEGVKQQVPLRTALELSVGDWVQAPEWAAAFKSPILRWEALKAGDPEHVIQSQYGNQPIMLLPAGEYQLRVTPLSQSGEKESRFVWPEKFRLKAQEHAVVTLSSGILLEAPRWAGPLWRWDKVPGGAGKGPAQIGVGPVYRWEVTPAGKPDQVLRAHFGTDPAMILPPGDYQIAIRPVLPMLSDPRWVWPQVVKVPAGQPAIVSLDSGVRLELPAEAAVRYQWFVSAPARPEQPVQWHAAHHHEMLLPPGEYRVGAKPAGTQGESVLWPDVVKVRPGETQVVRWSSGISMEAPPDKKARGDFRIQDADSKKTVQWGATAGFHPLPPGKYIVLLRLQADGPWHSGKAALEVKAHQVAAVRVADLVAGGADQERAEALALLDKAAKAVRVTDKAAAYKALTWKGDTKAPQGGVSVMSSALMWPDRARFVTEVDVMGKKTASIIVQQGDKMWHKFGDMPVRVDKIEAYSRISHKLMLGMLNPALLKEERLVPLGLFDVEGRPAYGVALAERDVAEKDVAEARMFFDQDTSLPVKTELRMTVPGLPMPISSETYYKEFKEFAGVRLATLWISKQNGKHIGEFRLTDIQPAEKLDDSHFKEP